MAFDRSVRAPENPLICCKIAKYPISESYILYPNGAAKAQNIPKYPPGHGRSPYAGCAWLCLHEACNCQHDVYHWLPAHRAWLCLSVRQMLMAGPRRSRPCGASPFGTGHCRLLMLSSHRMLTASSSTMLRGIFHIAPNRSRSRHDPNIAPRLYMYSYFGLLKDSLFIAIIFP